MKQISNHWRIEMMRADLLKPNPDNPHKPNRKQKRAYESLIRRVGSDMPIVIDEGGVILVGEARWEAYKALGHIEVPVNSLPSCAQSSAPVSCSPPTALSIINAWTGDISAKFWMLPTASTPNSSNYSFGYHNAY